MADTFNNFQSGVLYSGTIISEDDLCGTVTLNQGGTKPMNKFIEENVKLTKDAVLVDKYFGSNLNSTALQLLFKTKINLLIKEAKRLDKESKEKK